MAALTLAASACLAQEASLPPLAGRSIEYETHEATWPAADMSPDGRTILFDVLGDIYALDRAGGTARPVLTGAPYETQPVFSPDGRRIAFISDRSGREDLWVADADGGHPRRISNDVSGAPIYSSPAWSPDGTTLYVSRMTYNVLAFEIWSFDLVSGKSEKLTKARPLGEETHEDRRNSLGVAASPDGRYLYYSVKTGTTWTEHHLPHWSLIRKDLSDGSEQPLLTAPGGAMHPALSHDGRRLVYATRDVAGRTGLRLRDLVTGDDRPLLFPVDPDGQFGGYYSDLLPRFSFTPDDRSLLLGLDGGLKRLDIATGALTDIPFTVAVHHEMGPQLRTQHPVDVGPVHVRIIQHPRLSPDGRHVAFGAVGRIYVSDVGSSAPPRELKVEGPAWQPSWSADGKSLVFVTWSADVGGHIWTASAFGAPKPRRLTAQSAYYAEPMFNDGEIVALRASEYDRLHQEVESWPDRPTEIVRLAAHGEGQAQSVVRIFGARSLTPGADAAHVQVYAGGWVISVALQDGGTRKLARFIGIPVGQYVDGAAPLEDARVDRAGDRALLRSADELFVAPLPAPGKEPPVIDLRSPDSHSVKLTAIGANESDWSADGHTITWSVGSTFRAIPAEAAIAAGQAAEARAQATRLDVVLPRDIPHGSLLLSGAKIVTMAGDAVIANGDVLITDNRIVAVGPHGSLRVPPGALTRDLSGKVITPGFIDVHAHWFETRRDILDIGHWDFSANLAYGVTAGLDPQSFDPDIFAYADMIDAGLMLGPRAYSTGPGVFVNTDIRSLDDAVGILTRYRDDYGTFNLKEYMTGDRTQRRYLIAAAAKLGMMPTTEGASDLRLDLTQALDGYPGNEHSLPVAPVHDDIRQLYVRAGVAYSPTLLVVYGAPEAAGNFSISHLADDDDKLRRFVPPDMIARRFASQDWTSHADEGYQRFARQAIGFQRAGGLLGMGSHGVVQGLAYHWEMEALAAGGATPMEVLHAATIGSAQVIGRATDLGSLEPGKLADLLVFDEDPTSDIRNSKSLALVMKNGRLYDAHTLDELWPRNRPFPHPWFDAPSPAAP